MPQPALVEENRQALHRGRALRVARQRIHRDTWFAIV